MAGKKKLAFVISGALQFCLSLAPVRTSPGQDMTDAIRISVGYVDVCLTVKDASGAYVGGLSEESFRVYENGHLQEITSFQSFDGELTCAIVLDTTGSMNEALPTVKNAVMQLIDRFRPEDWFGIYSFDSTVRLIQDFGRDKVAAKRAVLRLQPGGATALFDALSRVARGLDEHKGKVAVIVFTDGSDNASALTINSAIERAQRLGMPVYAVAQGEALRNRRLLEQLQLLATTTGGASYVAKRSGDIEQVFSDISRELQNTYMLGYYAPPGKESVWRTIQVTIPAMKDVTIRTKQGYLPRNQ